MKCPNCGADLADDARFCTECGTAVSSADSAGAQQTPPPAYNSGAQQTPPPVNPVGQASNNDSLLMVLKIFGYILAGVFAIVAVVTVFKTFGALIRVFTDYHHVYRFFMLIGSVLALVSNLVLSIGFLASAGTFKKERSTNMFSITLVGVALKLVYLIYVTIVSSIRYGHFTMSGLTGFLVALVFAAILFGLLYAANAAPYIGMSSADIQASLKRIGDDMNDSFNEFKGTVGSNNGQNGAPNQGYQNQGYQGAPNQGYQNQGYQGAPNQGYQNQGYQGGYGNPVPGAVITPLKSDRSLWMYILLTLVTCGIYSWIFIYQLAKDMNVACAGDGKDTAGLVKFILLGLVTCGIYCYIWYYSVANRLQENAPRYGLMFSENGTTVLLWFLFGSMLCGIGPFIAWNIIIKNSNAIFAAYNRANGLA